MRDLGPLVSILMNCFNGAAYLREALDSVFAQTYFNWEIVFWDNQSTDRSAEIVHSYASERIRYFYAPEHTHLGKARNMALAQARGEWIGLLDTDDVWLSHKLESQVARIRQCGPELGLVYCRTQGFTDKGKQWEYPGSIAGKALPQGKILRDFLVLGDFASCVSILLSKVALDRIGGFPEHSQFCMDYYVNTAIASKYEAAAVDDICCRYRIHSNSLSSHSSLSLYREAIAVVVKWKHQLTLGEFNSRMKRLHTLLAVRLILGGRVFHGVWELMTRGSVKDLVDRFLYALRRGWQTGHWRLMTPG